MSLLSPAALTAAPRGAARWLARVREFHAYHGVWALGVKLQRRWTVRAKVLVMLAIVALPLVPLTLSEVRRLDLTVDDVVDHRDSMQRLATLAAMLRELHGAYLALEAGQRVDEPRLRAALDAMVTSLTALEADGHGELQSWARARTVVRRAVLEGGMSPAGRIEAIDQARLSIADIRYEILGRSDVRLTHDLDLDRMSTLAFELLPDLHRTLGTLRRQVQRYGQVRRDDARGDDPQALVIAMAGEAHEARRLLVMAERQLTRMPADQATTVRRELPRVRALDARLSAMLLSREGPDARAMLVRLADEARAEVSDRGDRIAEAIDARVRDQLNQVAAERNRVFGLLALCLAVTLYLFYTFYLVLRGGLNMLGQQAQRMARGDLSARPVALGGDEVAAALQSLTTSLARLSDLMASVRNGVGAVTQAAEQVALGNADLADRNRQTAGGLDGVVGSVKSYTEQLEACGRQVEAVVQAVQTLRLEAARNRKQMDRLQERLGSLRGKSREIADIVRLIDGIAFRTNILALNASVEAAKAGEVGRGFAVVAQEVRSLAMRSAESARRIDGIVSRSTEDIERSADLADETAASLSRLDGHVDEIRGAMDGVAGLTRKGEEESEAILSEVERLQQASSKNQALVEQLATAGDALRQQGERLAQSVAQFKLS